MSTTKLLILSYSRYSQDATVLFHGINGHVLNYSLHSFTNQSIVRSLKLDLQREKKKRKIAEEKLKNALAGKR